MIITAITFFITATILLGLGIHCLRSKTPVPFYTGETPPRQEQVRNVAAWNRKHGLLWIGYAAAVLLGYGGMALMGDTLWALIPFACGLLGPMPAAIALHSHWMKTDLVRE